MGTQLKTQTPLKTGPGLIGTELGGMPHTITRDKLVAFERVVWQRVANVHNDPETARRVGMTDMIASGQNQLAFLHQLMAAHFGDGWTYGGQVSVRWVCPVYVGDVITPQAVVRRVFDDAGRPRAEVDIWCVNQSGVRTALGTAQAYLQ